MWLARLRIWAPVLAGPAAGALIWLLQAPAGMPPAAHMVAGLAAWMAVWWLTAVLPLAVTALLPLAFMPLLTSLSVEQTARPYADPIIFLFLGGLFLAAATERWQLHRRLSLAVIGAVGTDPPRLVLALMVATAFVSMWISNTATAVLILFVCPASLRERRFTLDWPTAERIPWGVLVLFGGGLALAEAFTSSGLAEWIGRQLEGLHGAPTVVVIGARSLPRFKSNPSRSWRPRR